MKCNFNREDIVNYAEGGLSQDKTAEIKQHIDNCDECRSFYGLMTLSASYASSEAQGDRFFYEKVIRNIDSGRYKERKIKYSLGKFLSIIRPALKPAAAAAAALCIVALVIGLYGQQVGDFMNSQSSNKIAGNTPVEDKDGKYTLDPTPVTNSGMTAAENRPETKSGYLSIEGMDEEHRFNLVKSKPLGFSTYISDDLVAEPLQDTTKGDTLFIYANYSGKLNKDVFIRFYSPGNHYNNINTVEEMRKSTEQGLKSEHYKVESVSDSVDYFYPKSEVELRAVMNEGEKDAKYCGISIFKHGGRIYEIMYQFPSEYEEGFRPRVNKVLSEIMWYDGLNKGEATKGFIIKIGSSGTFEETANLGNSVIINSVSQYTVGVEQSSDTNSEFTAVIDQSRDSFSEYPIYIMFPGKELSDDSSAVNVSIKPESWHYIPKGNFRSDILHFCINITDPSVKGEIVIDKVLDKDGNSLISKPIKIHIQPDAKSGISQASNKANTEP